MLDFILEKLGKELGKEGKKHNHLNKLSDYSATSKTHVFLRSGSLTKKKNNQGPVCSGSDSCSKSIDK